MKKINFLPALPAVDLLTAKTLMQAVAKAGITCPKMAMARKWARE